MLKVKNATVIFNKEDGPEFQKVALDNFSVEINEGDFVTIIGGNGSGKTTLMNVISGVCELDQGEVYIDSIRMTNLKENERATYIGRVFQDPLLGSATNMSILENLEIASRRGRKKTLRWGFKKENEKFFKESLSALHLGLEDKLYQKMGVLSGGQRQAITLIMATLSNPKILLLDEHTAALDPKTASKVLNLTNEIVSREHLTTLMITHNMRDALKYGNRLIMLSNGKLIVDVSGEEKKKLTTEDLLKLFETGGGVVSDKMLF